MDHETRSPPLSGDGDGPEALHGGAKRSDDNPETKHRQPLPERLTYGQGSNRLPALAQEIRTAHSGVESAARSAAERAIEAGRALVEAKALVKHGQWIPWLRENCEISERTAQLYMKIAASGLKSETVADIGLKGAAGAIAAIVDNDYDPFFHCPTERRDWLLYVLFLAAVAEWPAEKAWRHVEWALQKQFNTPAEWLREGLAWLRHCGLRNAGASPEFIAAWERFQIERRSLSADDVESLIRQLPQRSRVRRYGGRAA